MNTFIDAVNAELVRRHQGLRALVGWKERSLHTQPPMVCWVADAADYGDPVIQERMTPSLVGRVVKLKVEVWGTDPAETNVLVKSVLRVMHRTGTAGSYAVVSEQWEGLEGSGGAILGEMCTLTVGVRDDVDDDEETTSAGPHTQAPPDGGFE